MLSPDQQPAANRLEQALTGLRIALDNWLEDCFKAGESDPAFTYTFRRWEEQLTVIKLYLHRAEARLLHFIAAVPPTANMAESSLPQALDHDALGYLWRKRFESFFTQHHLDGAYRRLESVLDYDQEAITADIITDLTIMCELAQRTSDAIADMPSVLTSDALEELAFYRVISPWRTHGHPALSDTLRWLSETLREQEDW
jgi:hypothetical protein